MRVITHFPEIEFRNKLDPTRIRAWLTRVLYDKTMQ